MSQAPDRIRREDEASEAPREPPRASWPRELRRYRRCRVALEARLSTLDADVDMRTRTPFYLLTEARTLDVGEEGAALSVDAPMPAGRRVIVELHLPDGTLVLRHASVRWSRPGLQSCRLGVCFNETVPGLVDRIGYLSM